MNRRRILVVAAVGLCAALWTYACGDGATEPSTPPPDPPQPATVTVSPATAQLVALGATVQLSAEVRDQNGNAMARATVTWASSAASVATVSSTGLVTAVGNGTASMTATAGAVSGTATVTVAQEVSTVVVSPAEATLVHGDTLRLTAGAVDANGHAVAGAEFEWTSSDTSVVAVDASGLATGVGLGEAEVSATSSGVSDSAALVVAEPTPTTVAVTPDTVALMALGDTVRLVAEVRDQLGRVMEDEPGTWVSGDTMVAAVDSAGLVTAVGTGATRVTATAGDAFGSAAVTVMQSAGSVEVSPAAATIASGDTVRLTAEAFDENGHPVAGAEFAWSSSDVSVATVGGSGLVHGVAEGTATITATAGSAYGSAAVTVRQEASPDRAALVALHEATDGRNWTHRDNWLTHAPLKDWYGVEVNGEGRVISLELPENGLVGHLPPELGDLAELEGLELDGNVLTGAIPPELGSLSNLRWLSVVENKLEGRIPAELGDLAELEGLELARNQLLTGPIPPELGRLSKLERLWIGGTGLTGAIPPELGNLSKLRALYLKGAYLTGPIPPELGQLTRLVRLYLSYNHLTGGIPPELGNLSNLEDLQLGRNKLTGALPMSVLRITGLERLQIQENAGLCVPGTTDFVEWAGAIDDRKGPFCNEADRTALDSLYGAAGGTNWTNADGWLGDAAIGLWHGVGADSLGRVVELDLAGNGLTGRLPPGLGDLERMTMLRIGNNALSGRLPVVLARLPLVELRYADTELCAPHTPSFQTWLDGIASHEGTGAECVPVSNRAALVALYEATNGPNWTNGENWLTDAPLGEWHGVGVDREGQVTSLNLRENGLAGSMPPEVGDLAQLTILALGNNDLGGPVPPELSRLSELRYLRLSNNYLTGSIPPELGNLTELEVLNLGWNTLTGLIPPELGNLSKLTYLSVGKSDFWRRSRGFSIDRHQSIVLTGPIPPELGNLSNLESLVLNWNSLTGEIPPELGNLASLTRLSLSDNDLTGPLPSTFGGLSSLEQLQISRNGLTGPLPAELGGLTSLETLFADRNALSGPVPAELGGLARLENLDLSFNNLTGPVPSEFGGLASSRTLRLTGNAEMSGALPGSLTALEHLDDLAAGGTGLCAPGDAGFAAWLRGIPNRRIASCSHALAATYLTQAVQSRENPVPLVAGDDALLRVFPVASVATDAGIPPVRARFYLDDREMRVEDIPGKPGPLPTEVVEGSLETSANAVIPGSVIQPGLEMVVEIDPDGTLDPSLGVARRIPETGRLAADVHELPFHLTLVPFMRSADPDSLVLSLSERIAADPHNDEALRDMRTLLPVPDDFGFTLHEPVWTSDNSNYGPQREVEVLQVLEGATGQHYMAMLTENGTSTGIWQTRTSLIYVTDERRTSDDLLSGLIAHEMGHSMSLGHAPGCRPGDVDGFFDPSYPYPTGHIGVWGYDFQGGGRLIPPHTSETMGHCGWATGWISDYNFTKMFRHRLRYDRGVAAVTALLLWGGVNEAGVPFLEPAFVVDAAPVLPDSAGDYTIAGTAHDGRDLFSLNFALWEAPDGEGNASFVFALPVRSGWADALASITLSGPAGTVTLDGDSDREMTILRNPRNGQVRAILRDLADADVAQADAAAIAAGAALDVLFSRGIPDAAAWRR